MWIKVEHNLKFIGPKHRQRFLCEVRVDGIAYVGAGNSMTKKEAQMNASRDFVNYLVRSGQVAATDVPEDVKVKTDQEKPESSGISGFGGQQQYQRPVFQVIKNIYFNT